LSITTPTIFPSSAHCSFTRIIPIIFVRVYIYVLVSEREDLAVGAVYAYIYIYTYIRSESVSAGTFGSPRSPLHHDRRRRTAIIHTNNNNTYNSTLREKIETITCPPLVVVYFTAPAPPSMCIYLFEPINVFYIIVHANREKMCMKLFRFLFEFDQIETATTNTINYSTHIRYTYITRVCSLVLNNRYE